ncbi:MAG: hypothetical protein AAF204_01215 [Pseudomonadota bacterium]
MFGMIYFMGILGFVGGFIVGQMILFFLLRHKSNEELLNDRGLKFKYGLIGWACAIMGAYAFVETYKIYFL